MASAGGELRAPAGDPARVSRVRLRSVRSLARQAPCSGCSSAARTPCGTPMSCGRRRDRGKPGGPTSGSISQSRTGVGLWPSPEVMHSQSRRHRIRLRQRRCAHHICRPHPLHGRAFRVLVDRWELATALGDLLHRDALRAWSPPKMPEAAYRRARMPVRCVMTPRETGSPLRTAWVLYRP